MHGGSAFHGIVYPKTSLTHFWGKYVLERSASNAVTHVIYLSCNLDRHSEEDQLQCEPETKSENNLYNEIFKIILWK